MQEIKFHYPKATTKKIDSTVNVAFINPPHADWCLTNNAAYLMFQSHYTRHGKYSDQIRWIPAPYKFDKYNSIEDIYEEVCGADIYLFSCYVWNYDLNDKLAQLIKDREPSAITVLGGPHIGSNQPDLLEQRTMYDYILLATKPGEVFVEELLDSYIENNRVPNFKDLSWELRSEKACDQFMPEYSVYEDHKNFLKETRSYAAENNLEPFCIIETTRGCPYKCSFCEWGGGIGSKIYKKPIEIVKKDILALKYAGFRDVYLTDANFGAFQDRDLDIFKFAWQNNINLTDISTMKSKSLKRRIDLIDAWFEVVGSGPELHSPTIMGKETNANLAVGADEFVDRNTPTYISVVPTVSIQSVSEEAMKVAERIDLSFEDKIKLSEHIYKRCHEESYPVPAIELILGMPGSTKEDFYRELEILYNFKAWTSFRHDYMFLPDSEISKKEYLEKYKIQLVDVYSDLIDEAGVDNDQSLYRYKQTHFKTISSCYSYSYEDMCEMWFMNIAGNYLLEHLYPKFENDISPSEFGKIAFSTISELEDFAQIYSEIKELLDPTTSAKNIKRIQGQLRNTVVENLLENNYNVIYSRMFVKILEEEICTT